MVNEGLYASIFSSLNMSYQVTLFNNTNTVIAFFAWVQNPVHAPLLYFTARRQTKLDNVCICLP